MSQIFGPVAVPDLNGRVHPFSEGQGGARRGEGFLRGGGRQFRFGLGGQEFVGGGRLGGGSRRRLVVQAGHEL